jgi:hypothetical protein
MEQSVQMTVGMENEVRKRPYSSTVLAQKTRDFGGTVLVLRGIFLGWKCVFAAVLYFPEAE